VFAAELALFLLGLDLLFGGFLVGEELGLVQEGGLAAELGAGGEVEAVAVGLVGGADARVFRVFSSSKPELADRG